MAACCERHPRLRGDRVGRVFGVYLVITVWFPYRRWFLLVILDLTGTVAVWAILTIIYPATAITTWTNLHC